MSPEPEQLRPALERAQTELDANLAEACDSHAADESTGKLIRLEELLTDAAHAAKEAISIRRRLSADRQRDSLADGAATRSDASGSESEESAEGEGIREFVDSNGTMWRVWEVPPEQLNARARPGPFSGDFEGGWLAFESADGSERRRLPGYPRDWYQLANEKIEALWEDARPVTRRRRGPSAPNGEPRDDSSTNAG